MTSRLDREVASSLDARPELLPALPALLAGIDALGSDPAEVVSALRLAGFGPAARVLDLGCGKGAVAVAVAAALGAKVDGVDAVPAFVEAAGVAARARGVAGQCRFRVADLRALAPAERHDAVLWTGVGRLGGGLRDVVRLARGHARPGGLVVVDDVHDVGPGGRAEARAALTALGDALLVERATPPATVRAREAGLLAALRANVAALRRAAPEWARLADAYLDAQERAARALVERTVPCLWVLARGDG